MDLSMSQLTYHSRRKDNISYPIYAGLNFPLKQTQNKKQEQPSSPSFPLNRQSYLTNNYQPQISPQSLSNAFQQQKQTPFLSMNVSKDTVLQEQNYELSLQRQKIKTLTQHLKSSLQANNQIEKKYNLMKNKLQEKQMRHMNQISVTKAEIIILKKQLLEKEQEINKKDGQNQILRRDLEKSQEREQMIFSKLEETQKQMSELISIKTTSKTVQQNKLLELEKLLRTKDTQIENLKSELSNLSEQSSLSKRLQSTIQQLKSNLIQSQKHSSKLETQNDTLYQQSTLQKQRIKQLNQHLQQICHNSQELFEEIRNNKMEKQIFNKKLDEKEQIIMQLEEEFKKNKINQSFRSISLEDLKGQFEIAKEQYRLLGEKCNKLQEENQNLSKNNSSLLEEVHLLELQLNQLKQLCLNQTMKQNQLTSLIKEVDERYNTSTRANINSNRDAIKNLLFKQQKPTKDIHQQKSGLSQTESLPYFNCNYQEKSLNSFQPNQPRFNYLRNFKQNPHIEPISATQVYSQFLSFEPSRPYAPSLTGQQFYNSKRRVSTCMNQRQMSDDKLPLSKNYDQLFQSRNIKKQKRSQSFQNEKRTHLITEPSFQVYKSLLNSKNQHKHRNSISSMRSSLDLKQKSSEYRKSIQNLPKQHYKQKNNLIEKIYNQNLPQDSNLSKNMFFTKLDKMKLWAKPTKSQNMTQRQTLREIPITDDYFKNKDISIQSVIRQKSSIMNQRKNLLTFNLNNHMIQKNILKLQKNTNNSDREILQRKFDIGTNIHKENKNDTSIIYENQKNRVNNDTKISSSVYKNCKKVLYNQ